jgi:invasion protein IalB
MKDTIAGVVLAVLFLTGLFAAAHYLPHGARNLPTVAPIQIPAGFVGNRMIGPWDLLCGPKPQLQNNKTQQDSEHPAAALAAAGHCRLAHGYVNGDGKLILMIAFRMIGPQRAVAMLVRFPPAAKKGDIVLVKFGQVGLRLPVYSDCPTSVCIAVGALVPVAESLLASAGAAQVILPPRADGKRITIGIRLDGIGPGLRGLRRAES